MLRGHCHFPHYEHVYELHVHFLAYLYSEHNLFYTVYIFQFEINLKYKE